MNKKNRKLYCPECDGELELRGHFHNSNEEFEAIGYVCEDCDQLFALMPNGDLAYFPANAKGEPTHFYCKTCGIDVRHRSRVVWVLNESLNYDNYCSDCGIEVLRNCTLLNLVDRERVDKDNVYEVAELQSLSMSNHVFGSPDLIRKSMNTPEARKLFHDMGLSDDDIDKRIDELAADPNPNFVMYNESQLKTDLDLHDDKNGGI